MKTLALTIIITFVAQLASAFDPVPHGDGLYAVFTISGGVAGEFTARLDYDKVPLTVANFVGLAEGSVSWVDLNNGQVMNTPFYDGIIFHRVAYNFVIQGGSPAGTGSDGPGYSFPDEIDPTLTHSAAGKLSMANSGTNTNGSQFFVTLNPTTSLDGKHAVFGEIVEGMDVVNTIGAVPLVGGASDGKPITEIVMESVVIVRQGAGATAFDAAAWQLPDQQHTDATLTKSGAELNLAWERDGASTYYIYQGTDIENLPLLGSLPNSPLADGSNFFFDIAGALPDGEQLFSAVVATPPVVEDKAGATLSLDLGSAVINFTFGPDNTGTYEWVGVETGMLNFVRWLPVGDQFQLYVDYSETLDSMQIYLDIESGNTGNTFVRLTGNNLNVTGTFTYTPPAP